MASLRRKAVEKATVLKIKNKILELEAIFRTPANEQYLAYWFVFFEEDFFKKDFAIKVKQYQLMQVWLNKLKTLTMTDTKKEDEFFLFKLEKEKFFPWDEELEFELVEVMVALEADKQQTKTEVTKTMTAVKKQLYCNLFNKKCQLKQKLYKTNQKQVELLYAYDNSFANLASFVSKKNNIFFKLKSKIIKFITFGYYDQYAKLIEGIAIINQQISRQKTKLYNIGLEICDIKKCLANIEAEIKVKKEQVSLFTQSITSIIKEINVINVQNWEVSPKHPILQW